MKLKHPGLRHLYKILLSSLLIFIVFSAAPQQPVYSYLDDFSFSDASKQNLNGPARIIEYDGRRGLNLTSIKSTLELKAHNLKSPQGTVSIWVMPLEELSTV